MTTAIDNNFMRHALSLAARAVGRVAPNPAVGCVIVKDGLVIGRGYTQDSGRPHAETEALKQAEENAKGATAYVSLEPCAHHGKTPPCAEALVKAGIKRCVIACTDPDPRVAGKGIEILKNADIEITEGVLEDEAKALNAGFFMRLTQERPYITLKLATSADHKIAIKGERTQISGEIATRYMHLLRSLNDGIMVGKNTAAIDQPKLTTRIEGYTHESQHFVLSDEQFDDPRDLGTVLKTLAEQGITRLLVEGGAQTATAFLESGYVDEFHHVTAPHTIGENGLEALKNHDISSIEADFNLKKQKTRALGQDLLEIYARKA